ncbi:MAG TPA: hypothetical protein VMI32_15675 [Candidatus Solibacter sp.]|nr:hypothetical protein [Candidatus Solibacter sp.]
MDEKTRSPISRREFARRAAIVSAVSLVPVATPSLTSGLVQPLPQQPSDAPSLSPESQAEASARYQAILALYGARFSDTQKTELQRLCFLAQPPIDRIRAFGIENGDSPALYLKPLMEREKKPAPSAIRPKPNPAAKKS